MGNTVQVKSHRAELDQGARGVCRDSQVQNVAIEAERLLKDAFGQFVSRGTGSGSLRSLKRT